MLENYFEKYGHKCIIDDNKPFRDILQDKSKLRKSFWENAVISPKYILLRSQPRSHAALRKEILHQIEFYPNVMHPFSELAYYFDLMWMFIISIWFILKPLDILEYLYAAHIPYEHEPELIKAIASILFIIDCIRRFFTGYVVTHYVTNTIILDSRQIVKHYLKTYFFFDFIPSLPLLLFNLYEINLAPGFRLILEHITLLRFVRLGSMMKTITNFMRLIQLPHNFIVIFNEVTVLIIITHWVSCFSVLPGIIERQFDPTVGEWYDNVIEKNATLATKYIICVHRSLSILAGKGYSFGLDAQKSEHDMIYTMFTAILGHILTLIIFAKIFEIINSMRCAKAKYEEMCSEISNYMEHHKLSTTTQKKIKKYYAFKYNYSYFNEYELLNALPTSLQQSVLLYSSKTLLDHIQYLKQLPSSVVINIVSMMTKEILLAGDVIFRCGEIGSSMYFVLNGTVAVFTRSGREISHLEDGSEFGQCLFVNLDNKHMCTAIAIETTELYILDSTDFFALANYCPDLVDQISNSANQRMRMEVMIEERYAQLYNKRILLAAKQSGETGFGRFPSMF